MKPKRPKSHSGNIGAKTPKPLSLQGDFDPFFERMRTAAGAVSEALFGDTNSGTGEDAAKEAVSDAPDRGIERLKAAVMADPIARAAYKKRKKQSARNTKKAQLKYIQDLVRVYAVVEAMTGNSGLQVIFLLRSEPLKAFGNKTADALIREGRADDVIAYIESIAGGAAG